LLVSTTAHTRTAKRQLLSRTRLCEAAAGRHVMPPRPSEWAVLPVYLRVDLGSAYDGDGGFQVEVNGVPVGQMNGRTQAGLPWYLGQSDDRWVHRVPREVLSKAPLVRVVLKPAKVDPLLSIAGHGDALTEPLGRLNSWFFDGQSWSSDRLAGPNGGSATGAYRLFWAVDQADHG
jgi:hypothetical protein